MQPVKFLKFLRQFVVLVERNLQLIWNDKLLLASLTLQSPFMVLVVKLTADPNCFTSNLVNIGSRTALFILAAMATFMGTLNSYREICREREIILREASVGVSLPAVVLSKAAVLLLVEVLQAAILPRLCFHRACAAEPPAAGNGYGNLYHGFADDVLVQLHRPADLGAVHQR